MSETTTATCPAGCHGLEIEPGVFSGCSCPEGLLANGSPVPAGFVCDCPNHGVHASDCAVHNEPAEPNGPCDCGLSRG